MVAHAEAKDEDRRALWAELSREGMKLVVVLACNRN